MRTRITISLLLCACLAAPGAAFANQSSGTDLIAMVPEDTSFLMAAGDTPGLIKQWRAAPFSRLWNDPQVKRFFAPLREQMEIDTWQESVREETGYELEELLAMMTGSTVLYVSGIDELVLSDIEDMVEPSLVILAEIGDNEEKLEELLLRQSEEDETWVVEEVEGVELHIDRVMVEDEPEDQGGWSICNGVFILAFPAEPLAGIVIDLLDGGEVSAPLTATTAYQSVMQHAPDSELLLYYNLAQLMPALQTLAEEESAEEGSGEVDPVKVFEALKVESLLGAFASLDLDESTTAIDIGVTFSEHQGLMKALAYGPDEATRPAFIPAGATSFGSSNFDIRTAWAEIEKILNHINPAMLAMATAQVSAMTAGAGVELDLRKDLLENLTGELVVVQMPQEPAMPGEEQSFSEPNQVIALGIHQRQGIELTIETVKGIASQGSELFSEREFLGTTIYSLRVGEDETNGFSYGVTDDYFLLSVGGSTALEAVLIAMQKPGDSVWEQAKVKSALATLPAGATGIGYQDLAVTGNMIFELLGFFSEMDEEGEGICNPEEIPGPEVLGKYLGPMASAVYKSSNSLIMSVRALAAEAVAE
jgi:hypothetical protein